MLALLVGFFDAGFPFGLDPEISIIKIIFSACFLGLICAIFGPLSRRIIESKTKPNQGIRLTQRNSNFAGLFVALVLGSLFCMFVYYNEFNLLSGLLNGLMIGLCAGSVAAMWLGGLDVIQHYALSILLWQDKKTPRDYVKFLDHCIDRIFMQKAGGGYIFIHRMLMEYFAELEPKSQRR